MRIEIKKINKETAGWDIIPETPEDEKTICIMRNLIFWGLDGNEIVYAGREGDSSNKQWPIDALKFRKKKYK